MAGSVELQNITLAYEDKRPIIKDLSLSVEPGELIVVFGVSGVGKSTLLRAVCGLFEPSVGTIETAAAKSADRRPFGFVFQEPRLFPWRRVLSNVMLGLEGLSIDRNEAQTRAHDALDLVGLGEYSRRYPKNLSGGQRQRVGIARALAVHPDLLLMDEPFGALDAVTRRNLQNELLSIRAKTNASILFVTHDVEEAVYLADRVILLAGTPAQIVSEYRIDASTPRDLGTPVHRGLINRIREDLAASMHDPNYRPPHLHQEIS